MLNGGSARQSVRKPPFCANRAGRDSAALRALERMMIAVDDARERRIAR
ncbi:MULTISPECIES: hypothetical protein [Bradyrhizobium]|nr:MULTISPECIES: hypothetical protein [Bradyrhizobium]UFW45886.1 hypothetical protein BaraCB756_26625 [Bradyrhizobium arachidis]